jgi:hypothetical protein
MVLLYVCQPPIYIHFGRGGGGGQLKIDYLIKQINRNIWINSWNH